MLNGSRLDKTDYHAGVKVGAITGTAVNKSFMISINENGEYDRGVIVSPDFSAMLPQSPESTNV